MYDSDDYAVQQIAAEFGVTRPTIYCPERARADFQDRLTEMRRRLERALDQLAARGAAGTAAFYLLISMFAGLAAASFGLVTGRAVAASRHRNRQPTAGRP